MLAAAEDKSLIKLFEKYDVYYDLDPPEELKRDKPPPTPDSDS